MASGNRSTSMQYNPEVVMQQPSLTQTGVHLLLILPLLFVTNVNTSKTICKNFGNIRQMVCFGPPPTHRYDWVHYLSIPCNTELSSPLGLSFPFLKKLQLPHGCTCIHNSENAKEFIDLSVVRCGMLPGFPDKLRHYR